MDCFHLLRLPTVALIEVLKCLDVVELYHISHYSRKMAQLIPLAGTKKIRLEIDFGDLELKINEEFTASFPRKPTDRHDSDIDMVERLKSAGYYSSALFKCPIKSVKSFKVTPNGHCRSIIEDVIAFQGSLENLKILGDLQNKDLQWILEKANVTGRLNIWLKELENVSIDLNLNCRHFYFDPARWVTVDNLVSLKSCKTIRLFKADLTYQDLDIVMGKWKSGLFPNLEYLKVDSISLWNDGTILGFSKKQLSAKKGFEREIM